MSFVLFALAAIAAAAGIMMIGFGVPINEFSLGNTLIIAGTTALTGGAVIAGLAIVSRQLRRLTEVLGTARPAPAAPIHAAETAEFGAAPAPRAAPMPRPLTPPREPREAYAERPIPAASPELFNEPVFEAPVRSRMEPSARAMHEAPKFEDLEEVPLSPRTTPRGPAAPSIPPAIEPGGERRGWRPPGSRVAAPAPAPASVTEPPMREMPVRPAAPARPAAEPSFDTMWPDTPRPPDALRDPFQDTAPRQNGVHFAEPAKEKAPAAAIPVSILKSGVVDGMAYTLYTDGSIEAELAQGVVRFGSIEELRNHLEKSN
ncbi:MAG: hypothetical protein GHHEDOFH_01965 [Pseudorhodoplanes sp.]|nr:hypothetical protein [Pseudorhodoplanes sp.]